MAHIAINGTSIAGLPCAYELREQLDSQHQITVINNRDHFQFTPSNPWRAVGWRTAEDIAVPLKPVLDKKNIQLNVDTVSKNDAGNNTLQFNDHETLH